MLIGNKSALYDESGRPSSFCYFRGLRYRNFPGVDTAWYYRPSPAKGCHPVTPVRVLLVSHKDKGQNVYLEELLLPKKTFFYARRMNVEEAIRRVGSFDSDPVAHPVRRFLKQVAVARMST